MIRKPDGRADSVFAYPRAALLPQDCTYYRRPKDTREKSELFSEQRLTRKKEDSNMGFKAPGRWALGDTKQGQQEGGRKILGRDGVICEKIVDFLEVGKRKAVDSISPDKGPKADTVQATAYQNL